MTNRKAEARFQAFLDEQPSSPNVLPLLHTSSAYSFADICAGDVLSPTYCKHFRQELLYLFYGRPAYRTELAEFSDLEFNWPIVFIFDPKKIDGITSIYPFDSGAFFLNLYNRFFSKQSRHEDFKLPGDLSYASKLVGTFYGDESEYILSHSTKNVEIPPMNFEAQGVHKLTREPAYQSRISEDQVTRDERSSAIEVQTNQSIDIAAATLAIVVPSRYLRIPLVVEALERWGISGDSIKYYETIGFHDNNSWLGQIYRQVADVYRAHGILAG